MQFLRNDAIARHIPFRNHSGFCSPTQRAALIALVGLSAVGCGPAPYAPPPTSLPPLQLSVFVTRQTWTGDQFRTQMADSLCTSAALNQRKQVKAPTFSSDNQWVAYVSYFDGKVTDDSFHAVKRVQNALKAAHPTDYAARLDLVQWFGTDSVPDAQGLRSGDPLFASAAGMENGPRVSSGGIVADENGEPIQAAGTACDPVWTGTELTGHPTGPYDTLPTTCRTKMIVLGITYYSGASWDSLSATGNAGCVGKTGTDWTDAQQPRCSTPGHLYCFQVK